ncbi:MAG TPA: alcohol dehydrogenase [Bacteroidales bacterium]|jgi:NADPH:quinone reductase-like Zn-dependent oxidoreductase|nr:alcohol dehydrogenase [Bacteroidales bacterium]
MNYNVITCIQPTKPMKAITYNKYGGTSQLKLTEVERPTPNDDEVLIKTKAAGVNDWDWGLVHGKPLLIRMMFGLFKPKKAKILGCDVAGIVEEVGINIKNLKVGDRVFGDLSGGNFGGFAEFTRAKEKELAIIPENMSFEEAAALPHAGVLAYQAFFDYLQLQPGHTVLINGAGGGVGTIGIPILKHLGVKVTGVDSSQKLDLMKSLGADEVLDYKQQDFSRLGKKWDLVIDNKVFRKASAYKRSLKKDGVLVMVGGSTLKVFLFAAFGSIISPNKKLKLLMHKPNKGIDKLIEFYNQGIFKPFVGNTFPLEKTPEAIEQLGKGKTMGKTVVVING